jgi:hypothetical protein
VDKLAGDHHFVARSPDNGSWPKIGATDQQRGAETEQEVENHSGCHEERLLQFAAALQQFDPDDSTDLTHPIDYYAQPLDWKRKPLHPQRSRPTTP